MKRRGFINIHPSKRHVTRLNPATVGFIVDDHDSTVLELELQGNGHWSLVKRTFGERTGEYLAQGEIE